MGQVLVIGAVNGTIYALFAVSVALVYRGARTVNFASGEVGTLSLFIAWGIVTDAGLPWLLGAAAAVAFAMTVGAAFEVIVVRRLGRADRATVAVATVGLLTLVLALEFQLFSASPRILRGPVKGLGIQVFDVYISPTQLIAFVVVIAVALALSQVLRRTDFGLGVLAAAQDPDTARLMGVPVGRVSVFVWAAGAGLAALAALLVVPSIGVFTPGFATELYVKGIVAAVIGGLASPTGAIAGGYALAVLESGTRRVLLHSTVPGLGLLVTLAVVLVVLVLRPTGILATARTRGAA
jgi:branched-chain amino acid transport system permease protein